MIRSSLIIFIFITLNSVVKADDILNELYDNVIKQQQTLELTSKYDVPEEKLNGKFLYDQSFEEALDICNRGVREWQDAAVVAYEKDLNKNNITKPIAYTVKQNTLANYGYTACKDNSSYWRKRREYTTNMKEALEQSQLLFGFFNGDICPEITSNSTHEDERDQNAQVLHIVEERYKALFKSYLSYIKSEISGVTKEQTPYYLGYALAWGYSLQRKISRAYNYSEIIDYSTPFEEELKNFRSVVTKSFSSEIFRFNYDWFKIFLKAPDAYRAQLTDHYRYLRIEIIRNNANLIQL